MRAQITDTLDTSIAMRRLRNPYVEAGVDSSSGQAGVIFPGVNDLAFNTLRGGTVTVTKNGAAYADAYTAANMFAPDWTYTNFPNLVASDSLVVEIAYAPGAQARFAPTIGLLFSPAFRATSITLEMFHNSVWSAPVSIIGEATGRVWRKCIEIGSPSITKLRYTMTGFVATSCQIVSAWSVDFQSKSFGANFLPRSGGDLYGTAATPPTITAAGGEANISLNLVSKGSTGYVKANGSPVVTGATATSEAPLSLWTGTKAQYDALTKSPNTIYVVTTAAATLEGVVDGVTSGVDTGQISSEETALEAAAGSVQDTLGAVQTGDIAVDPAVAKTAVTKSTRKT